MSDAEQQEPTAGSLLRAAREAAGLHLAALAVSLKVPVRKLELLEANRFDELPDAVFVRALASSLCRTLKIDVLPVLNLLPQTAAPRLMQTRDGINTPFRSPQDAGRASGWPEQLSRPGSLAVMVLLLGAVVMIFLPNFQREDASAKAEVGAPMAAPVVVESAPVSAESVAVNAGASANSDPAPVASTVALTATAVPAAAAVAAAPQAATPIPAVVAASGPQAAPGVVVFRARGPSWVEVTDSKGAVALRKLMAAGESVGVSGSAPLAVTVGSSNNTVVEVHGRAFDLNPVSKDNVARFEVK